MAATKKEAMEVLKADKKPHDSLIEAVLDSDDKVSRIKNGRLSKIMNCPKNGRCEYVYFTDRW